MPRPWEVVVPSGWRARLRLWLVFPKVSPHNLRPVGTEEGFVPRNPFAVQTFPLGYWPLSLLTSPFAPPSTSARFRGPSPQPPGSSSGRANRLHGGKTCVRTPDPARSCWKQEPERLLESKSGLGLFAK